MNDAHYLTDEWFDAAAIRVAAAPFSSESPDLIAFSYTISDLPDGHAKAGTVVHYRIDADPSRQKATLSCSDEPGDVTFAMTYDVAFAVATGATSGSRAFLDGSIRLGGNVAALIERANDLKLLNGLIGPPDA
ncbi:MAG: hypothetical protein ACN4GZ_05675 [Acidimicrobiales bacterium]